MVDLNVFYKKLKSNEVLILDNNENFCKISKYQKINLIPQNIISKEPSAELRFNQKDSDSLPDYEILDKISKSGYEKLSAEEKEFLFHLKDEN